MKNRFKIAVLMSPTSSSCDISVSYKREDKNSEVEAVSMQSATGHFIKLLTKQTLFKHTTPYEKIGLEKLYRNLVLFRTEELQTELICENLLNRTRFLNLWFLPKVTLTPRQQGGRNLA